VEGKKSMLDRSTLLQDLKETNKIGELFQFFTSKKEDVEYGEQAKRKYQQLGWSNNKHFDIINSFWITFSLLMHFYFPQDYPIAEAGNVKIYKYHSKHFYSFPEKYFLENSEERKKVEDLYAKNPDISKLAELCHSVANFMPCPKNFNSCKGLLNDVKDYLPLMVDKIQACVDNDTDLKYYNKDNEVVIDKNTINKWHSFLADNQKKYCLDMYYTVDGLIIKGIPFFTGQTLLNACPKNAEEVEECLWKMTKGIERRAEQLGNTIDSLA